MKKIVFRLSFSFFALGFTGIVFGQVDKDVLNWYNTNKAGVQTEKAYKLLKGRDSKPVIVAVIDSGVDIEHEDLKGKIWTNTKEIPGNGIDDDNNGYVDDVYGWSFLGSPNGKNQQYARLEKTRIYAMYKDEFDNLEEAQVPTNRRADYDLFIAAKKSMEDDREQYESYKSQMGQLPMIMQMVPQMVGQALGKENYTLKDLQKWKPKDAQQEQFRQLAIAIETGELSDEVIQAQIDQVNAMLDYYLNPELNDREFIGDDANDFNDVKYGSNDVIGPDATHGTHVSGIIAAIRGNGLGGDGVAENVQIMAIRAVPDGDEADKDIALAIRYAVDNGAQIINMSFGKGFSIHQKEVYEALKYADEHEVLCVHAAGNSSLNLDVEQNFPTDKYSFQENSFKHYLTVGASTRFPKGKLAAVFSNYGQTKVDIFAPGFEIYNAVPGNKYRKLQGTSMAAPVISGMAAVLKSYFPELSMGQIRDIIMSTATSYKGKQQNLPGSETSVDFGTLSVSGGVANLANAVKECIKLTK